MQMSMTRDVKPPAVQNAINEAMQTGQSVSYNDPRTTVTALPATSTPVTPAPAPVVQAPVVQTPLPITQPSVNVQNTGDMKMAKPDGVTETITRTAPAPFAEPFLQYGMSEALRQYQQAHTSIILVRQWLVLHHKQNKRCVCRSKWLSLALP